MLPSVTVRLWSCFTLMVWLFWISTVSSFFTVTMRQLSIFSVWSCLT